MERPRSGMSLGFSGQAKSKDGSMTRTGHQARTRMKKAADTTAGGAGAGQAVLPPVSVIVPARDAEATLGAALDSVLAQDYGGAVEVVVADGSEGGATAALVRRRYPSVRLVRNPGGSAPAGLNVALRAARHGVVARCDAGCVLPPGYLSRAVETLGRTGAANVGGRQRPVGATVFERATALAMSCWLGSGGAAYRVGGAEGAVDTVYLGVFERAALEAAGGFDEGLARNQDYELNWRLRERGWTVWFDPALAVDYRPRGSLGALARQYVAYGRWKRAVLRRHPRSWRARQLAAPLLVLALAASAACAAASLALAGSVAASALLRASAAAPLAWASALLAGSAAAVLARRRGGVVGHAPRPGGRACRTGPPRRTGRRAAGAGDDAPGPGGELPDRGAPGGLAPALLLPVVLATMHLAWGAGFLIGAPRDD